MSIAVSAIVRPSVCLRLLSAGMACCAIAVGAALAGGIGGAFLAPLAGAGASALAGVVCLLFPCQNRKPRRIDISGVGQIRATVYLDMGGAGEGADGVGLLPGSTLWPGLLLLRLRRDDGGVLVLALWPGNVGAGAFRPLAVACRAIAVRVAEV